ncbi:MAG: hypothetical protein JNJ46_22535 [Myxococcales bacterium]|nr:hypothetical protein [Myxococcales bacterium]
MVWILVGMLLSVWGIGVVTSHLLGGGIHVLFVIAILVASVSVLRHRNPL